jgi:hypothetical protein
MQKSRITMFSRYKLFIVLRLTVAYRLEGMRMLQEKLACGTAGNRWKQYLFYTDDFWRNLNRITRLKY